MEEHQRFQQQIQAIQAEISRKDEIILELAQQLKKAEQLLEDAVNRGRSRLDVIRKAEEGARDPEELVDYAHKVSYTTSAPPGWQPNMPLIMHRPPAPQEDEMRSGILYQTLPTPSK